MNFWRARTGRPHAGVSFGFTLFTYSLNASLELNVGKCVFWSPSKNASSSAASFFRSRAHHTALDFSRVAVARLQKGIILLEAPIDSDNFCRQILASKSGALLRKLERVEDIASPHVKYLLLRYCAVPRVSFALRTAPPSVSHLMALFHDEHMFSAFQSFTAVVFDNVLVRSLVQLPIKLTGAGI